MLLYVVFWFVVLVEGIVFVFRGFIKIEDERILGKN